MAEQRVRRNPRMALNALAQYMAAPPARREAILRDQKYPADFRVLWYDYANRAILSYLLDSDRDGGILTTAEQRIRALPADDRNESQKLRDNADAVAAFAACRSSITFDNLKARRRSQEGNIVIEGVTISVRPEVVLEGHYRGSECIGGIKLYLSKNTRLGDSGLAMAGAVLHLFLERNAPPDSGCATRHCTVIDVFGRACSCAPRAVVRRRNDIEAACREIAQRWPTIQRRG